MKRVRVEVDLAKAVQDADYATEAILENCLSGRIFLCSLVLKACGFPRAHRESVDVDGSGVRAEDLFRQLILDYRPLRVLFEVGGRDRAPVLVDRRKVRVLRHEVISLKGSWALTSKLSGGPTPRLLQHVAGGPSAEERKLRTH